MYYLAENLSLRREEFVQSLITSLACSSRDKAELEVDTCVDRLFHWAAYADKYGGSVQVRVCLNVFACVSDCWCVCLCGCVCVSVCRCV